MLLRIEQVNEGMLLLLSAGSEMVGDQCGRMKELLLAGHLVGGALVGAQLTAGLDETRARLCQVSQVQVVRVLIVLAVLAVVLVKVA